MKPAFEIIDVRGPYACNPNMVDQWSFNIRVKCTSLQCGIAFRAIKNMLDNYKEIMEMQDDIDTSHIEQCRENG